MSSCRLAARPMRGSHFPSCRAHDLSLLLSPRPHRQCNALPAATLAPPSFPVVHQHRRRRPVASSLSPFLFFCTIPSFLHSSSKQQSVHPRICPTSCFLAGARTTTCPREWRTGWDWTWAKSSPRSSATRRHGEYPPQLGIF